MYVYYCAVTGAKLTSLKVDWAKWKDEDEVDGNVSSLSCVILTCMCDFALAHHFTRALGHTLNRHNILTRTLIKTPGCGHVQFQQDVR
mgnify:CR=1 FL=1|jgi:hypothetical protein